MRKTKFILLILIVAISFVAIRTFEQGNGVRIINDVGQSENAMASASGSVDQLQTVNESEIYSQSVISTSSAVVDNSQCAGINFSAQLALVRPFGQNYSLYELNANGHWPIASITKLMTAVVAYENSNLDKNITLTNSMLSVDGVAGDFKPGEVFSGKDLMKAMLMLSSNKAAEALAQDFGRDKFMSLMNQKAKELNMTDTYFDNPTGLSVKNQSTANDIYKLATYVYNTHPEILSTTRTIKDYILEAKSHKKRLITNINEFAGTANFIGGKTGYIDESQGNLVSIFNVNKQPVITIVLGSQDRFGDTKKLLNCTTQ